MHPARKQFYRALTALAVVGLAAWFAIGHRESQRAGDGVGQVFKNSGTPPLLSARHQPQQSGALSANRSAVVARHEGRLQPSLSPGVTIIGSGWERSSEPELVAFRDWAKRYEHSPRTALIPQGVKLASARRNVLMKLMHTEPARVLASAVPWRVRVRLPQEVVALLETRVDGEGELWNLDGLPAPGQTMESDEWRSALVGGVPYRVYPAGELRKQNTARASLHGVAFDHELVVTDSPLRAVEDGEPLGTRPVETVCPVSGKVSPVTPGTQDLKLFDAGKSYVNVCAPGHAGRLELLLLTDERKAAPWLNTTRNMASGGGSSDPFFSTQPPPEWTTGDKRLLIIRVDFRDKRGTPVNTGEVPTGVPLTVTGAADLINRSGGVRDFFVQNSFGKASIIVAGPDAQGVSADVTPVLSLDRNTTEYTGTGGGDLLLHAEARDLAASAGYDLSAYQRVGVFFSGIGFPWFGLGNRTGPYFWINGHASMDVVAHELGHTFGLPHAGTLWVSGSNPIDTVGVVDEYGDKLDLMSDTPDMRAHFSSWAKAYLHWIEPAGVKTISSTGIYSVGAFDNPLANSASATLPLALRIARSGSTEYWIGHRGAFNATNTTARDGVHIIWARSDGANTRAIDCNQPDDHSATNAPLKIGQTLTDPTQGLTIKVESRTGSGVNEAFNVRVTFDSHLALESVAPVADERNGPFNLLLLRKVSTSGAVTGTWSTANGTALAGSDYTASGQALSFPVGDASPALLSIPITNDAVADDSETFTVSLQNLAGSVLDLPTNSITVRIKEPGAIDTSFHSDADGVPSLGGEVVCVVPDAKGRLLVSGFFIFDNRKIVRLFPDGSEDTSFVPGSIATSGGAAYAIAPLADGDLIVGGDFSANSGSARLQRLHENGSRDEGFNIGTGPNDEVRALLVQSDGKIVVGGSFTAFNGASCQGIVRLNTDGSLDGSFVGPSFFVGAGVADPTPAVYSVIAEPDDKLIVAGEFAVNGASPFQGGIARLNTDGSIDASFASGDGTALSSTTFSGAINDVKRLPSGKLVVGGSFTAFDGQTRGRLALLSSEGMLETQPLVGLNNSVRSLLALPDNSFFVAGSFASTSSPAVATGRLVHVLADGSPDGAFNSNASVIDGTINAIALDPESRRLVAGGVGSSFDVVGFRRLVRVMTGLVPVAPVITQQPSPVTVDENQPLTLEVRTNAESNWCQWYQDGVPVPGANSLVFTTPAVRSHNGSWNARITTVYGVMRSDPVAVDVHYKPVIISQPVNVIVNEGGDASFTVAAVGGSLSYQWQRNGVNIAGQTTPTLSITTTAPADAGGYQCVVSNATNGVANQVTSVTASLTVVAPPVIKTGPDDVVILTGQNVSLTTTATGLFLSYQWRKDGVNIVGATSPIYSFVKATTSRAGSYQCVVTNQAGSATTTPANVHVVVKPAITTQPGSQLRPATGSVTFTVAASGEFLSYQWQRGTTNLIGANGSSLTITPLTTADAGTYRCIVSNLAGSVASAYATLTIYQAPTISVHPVAAITTPRGKAVTFSVAAKGTYVAYQWQRDLMDIPGATGSSLIISYPDSGDEGAYRCVVSNGAGSVASSTGMLTVIQPPSIVVPPVGVTVSDGAPASFSVTATGTGLSYQWQRDGLNLAGATTSSYSIDAVSSADVGNYRCVVSNVAGKAASASATLAMASLPVITTQPLNVAAEAGANVTLGISATNATSYQWKRNGISIAAGTGSLLNIPSVSSGNTGNYTCVVGNGSGSVTSRTAAVVLVASYGMAMDNTARKWQCHTPGAYWVRQMATMHDGSDALQSGAILDGEACVLKTTVTGPTLVRFWRKVSSEANHDFLRYTVDGTPDTNVPDISGEQDWQECLSYIPAGVHELAWVYEKDAAGFYGRDAAWLDQFSTGIPTNAAGTYTALVERDLTNDNFGGLLTLTLTSTGSFTGSLKQGAKSYVLAGTGSVQSLGVITLSFAYTPSGSATKIVALTVNGGTEALTGTIDGVPLIEGGRHRWSSIQQATAFVGSYNCAHSVSVAQQGNAALPQGTGYTQVKVSTLGVATVTGKLADGTAIGFISTVWPDGRAPMFAMLYSNKGSIVGAHQLNSGTVTSSLTWLKNNGASTTSYPTGFGEIMALETDGAAWVKRTPVLGLSTAVVDFEEGGIAGSAQAASVNQTFTITAANLAQFVPAVNPTGLKLTINSSTGLFTGSFTLIDPANVKRTATISGVLLDHRSEGLGYFTLRELATSKILSGRVTIGAP